MSLEAEVVGAELPDYSMRCSARHIYSLVTGVALVYFPFGNGVVLAALPCLLTYLAMWRIREYASTLAWLVDFTYLIGW